MKVNTVEVIQYVCVIMDEIIRDVDQLISFDQRHQLWPVRTILKIQLVLGSERVFNLSQQHLLNSVILS